MPFKAQARWTQRQMLRRALGVGGDGGRGWFRDGSEQVLREMAGMVAPGCPLIVSRALGRGDAFCGDEVLIDGGSKGADRPETEKIGQESKHQKTGHKNAQASAHKGILTQAENCAASSRALAAWLDAIVTRGIPIVLMRDKRLTLVIVGICALAIGLMGGVWLHRPTSLQFDSVDVTGASFGRELSLVDHNGARRSLDDFRGKALLLAFGFTQCPDACPATLAKLAEVMRLLGPLSSEVQVVMVTVDPERDTPAVLARYVPAFHPSFLGLWGD